MRADILFYSIRVIYSRFLAGEASEYFNSKRFGDRLHLPHEYSH